MDETPNPLEERPFADELGDALRAVVRLAREEPPPAASVARALDRARRLGPGKVNPWLRYHRVALAAAVAAVLLLGLGMLLVCWRFEPPVTPPAVANGDLRKVGDDDMAVLLDPVPGRSRVGVGDGHSDENPFVAAGRAPVSTFPLTVDRTAYRDVRRALLEENRLPLPDDVRVADFVNSFDYSYPQPADGAVASLTVDLAACPWNAAHHLARVGLRGRADAAVPGAAVEVAFNPRRVATYRLIGYEGRPSRSARPAGETLAAGQTVTALYEIAPADQADDGEWLTVRLRCQSADAGPSRKLTGPAKRLAEAPADFRLAAAAAEFGLLLRRSANRGEATYAAVRAAVRDALGADPDGRRAELLALVDAADRLTSDRKLTQTNARSL